MPGWRCMSPVTQEAKSDGQGLRASNLSQTELWLGHDVDKWYTCLENEGKKKIRKSGQIGLSKIYWTVIHSLPNVW